MNEGPQESNAEPYWLVVAVAKQIWDSEEPATPWWNLDDEEQGEWITAARAVLEFLLKKVLMPEYEYWRAADEIAATGALANVIAKMKGIPLPPRETPAWKAVLREAMQMAERNVDLHIERDVYEKHTAEAVVQEFSEQLAPLLRSQDGTDRTKKGGLV